MAEVRLTNVKKRFGAVETIKGVDLTVADGEFCVFVGPSGCGKSTLLRLIAGLEEISSGALTIAGADMTHVDPANRGIAMVFQSYALYPHMTVRDNISFGLRMTGAPKDEIARRVAKAAAILKLEPLLERKPGQLSGGQRQRVAIGRAIVREPGVFLFDEPLSNLDAALRVEMRVEIGKLHQELKSTMIYVTHDQVEAMTMADKIVVLSAGRIEQVGSPLELYHRPKNLFVAGFIGSPKMNFIPVALAGDSGASADLLLPGGARLALPAVGAALGGGGKLTLGIRPEHMVVDPAGADLTGTVRLAEHLGSETMLHADLPDGTGVVVKADPLSRFHAGEKVPLRLEPRAAHVFDAEGIALVNGSLL